MRRTFTLFALAAIVSGCSTSSAPPSTQSTENPSSASEGSQTGDQNHTGDENARAATPNARAGAFGATCASPAECDSGVCFEGGKGGFCSVKCTSDADCPLPSSGAPHCNPHGYCRY